MDRTISALSSPTDSAIRVSISTQKGMTYESCRILVIGAAPSFSLASAEGVSVMPSVIEEERVRGLGGGRARSRRSAL